MGVWRVRFRDYSLGLMLGCEIRMYSLGNLKLKFGSQGSGLHLTFRETHQLRISVACNLTYSIIIKIKRVGRGKQGDAPSLVVSWAMNLHV